jgi:hypothetical protein
MTEQYTSPQPSSVELFRNVYDPKVFHAEDLSGALAIGQRLVEAVGVRPGPAELWPDDFDIQTERLSVTYTDTTRDEPNIYRSDAHLLGLDFASIEDGISVSARIDTHSPAAVKAVEQVADTPIQALPRIMYLYYAQPGQTLQAAAGLDMPDAKACVDAQARSSTFTSLLDKIFYASMTLDRNNAGLLAYLSDNVPSAASTVASFQGEAAAEQLDIVCHTGLHLKDIAIEAYAQSQSDDEHMCFVTAASEILRTLYERPERGTDYTYPHILTFGPRELRAHMSTNRLSAEAHWEGEPIDPRISVQATVEVDGAYDLREHIFATAERGNGHSSLGFVIARRTISPTHTESELGGVLDEQMRVIAEPGLDEDQMDAYREQLHVGEPVWLAKPGPGTASVKVTRFQKTGVKPYR